ncbi:MAG: hypothetical protein JXR64_06010 [Spirochaetales bacterium]|nr:hypothetical protein [Spirochaetales bacterium]
MGKKIVAKILNLPESNLEKTEILTRINELDINDVYILYRDAIKKINKEFIHKIQSKAHFVIQTLLNDNSGFPLAILENGEKAVGSDMGKWLEILCINGENSENVNIIDYRIEQITNIIKEYSPKGISLDFIRNFLFWEEIYENSDFKNFKKSCFCPYCIKKFTTLYGIELPNFPTFEDTGTYILKNYWDKWKEFTYRKITQSIEKIVSAIKEIDNNIVITIHVVPWFEGEFNFSRKNILGQNIIDFKKLANFISPMCYSPMLRRDNKWILDIVEEFYNLTESNILPAIQISPMYGTEKLSDIQFKIMVESALGGNSDGAVIWPWELLTKQQLKILHSIKSTL